ncbi:DUF6635 family protein [Gilvimarinus xylanilyticus]|uniref:Uncharacterized protein n=1 Tax=Gilvimarinus xylanilyticus TaxID=2944139 RepID=A0A9X2I2V2_9GAMM|nr:DUF6635 family protein [Gilvimarinus xylanilyticus]MCP8899813.1 hypothetical protein [Gilvimarinus xylanilyticus]
MIKAADEALYKAIEAGISAYFDGCRGRVPGFVRKHFALPGAWHTNRRALGWDLVRAPLNLLWAPVYILSQILAWLCGRLKLGPLARLLRRFPSGMQTQVQTYLMARTQSQLLEVSDGRQPLRAAIAQSILSRESLDDLSLEQERQLQAALMDALPQYALTRTASADISNTLLATLAGAFTLQKFTPGALAIGAALAGILAQQMAVAEFILGPWLGHWYYTLFPVQPATELVLLSTASTMVLLAVFACFSGLISDPFQAYTGIHQRRLVRMLNGLERDLKNRDTGNFRPKDAYLARVMDLLDAARISLM